MSDSLKQRVTDFCATEFNGDHANRVLFFIPSIREINSADFATEPVDIVDSFKILSITIKGKSAKAVVEYSLVAELKNVVYHGYPGGITDPAVELNLADKLVIIKNPTFHQELSWKFNEADQKWYLASTQLPKVSQSALVELLRAEVRQETDTLNKNSGKSLPYLEGLRTWHLRKIELVSKLEESNVNP